MMLLLVRLCNRACGVSSNVMRCRLVHESQVLTVSVFGLYGMSLWLNPSFATLGRRYALWFHEAMSRLNGT